MVSDNLKIVEENIQKACDRAGRDRSEVTLIAVSKTKPVDMLMEAYNDGIRTFGENKVQELTGKIEEMPDDISWHMIGHLQRNKVKYIAGKVALIHSVDSYRLAEEINVQAKKHGTVIPILIEVNVAQEDTKFGVKLEETEDLVRECAALDGISIKGLMTIAPFVENPEDNRPVFKALKDKSVDIASKNIDNVTMDILSMGMTNDYQIAIEEGATMVRVGTGIFGARNYNI
ncbi:MAG: YggS family pyridoxal phosphate-dependent enzyme [Lachnospiraceae bacterium]|uniref:Pyridoxal phosphate homeostasis protein n=1 Tax=Candidatus Weimeria bifida TaxID=2599074 RepID=A0A6N7IYT6_9FIRM|nr:YggS family pyridoxal phosphate-dependent enzyme [Candidatus Weimeria bifida]RRF97108.1 MAG: YggS family pyridoxal phosphate-dependent enzyme [Lachnospiraceae bacterium]